MWIKICANTNLEDALLAAELGADAVGFVFAPSPRRVDSAQVASITRHLPPGLETVGVFPAWQADRIVETVKEAELSTIQLHGVDDPGLARTLYNHFAGRVAIIQVVHWNIEGHSDEAKRIAQQMEGIATIPEVDRILIDSKAGSATGGTGTAFPWKEAKGLFACHPKIILAGGLNQNNVAEAIDQLKPWGVDVASGVESAPGKKDEASLKTFIHAARNASMD